MSYDPSEPIDDLLTHVERVLAPLHAAGHEVQFELSYYVGFRELSDKGYALWWRAEIARSRKDIGVAAVERTPDAAIRMALGLAREYPDRFEP